jgi:hypothetical protein
MDDLTMRSWSLELDIHIVWDYGARELIGT